jgi:hypothetical protein
MHRRGTQLAKQLYDEEQDLDIEVTDRGDVLLIPNIEEVQAQGSLLLPDKLMEEIVSAWLETRQPVIDVDE